MSSLSRASAEFALDIECLKEKNNFLAVSKGMPGIGSVLKNAHGIEWTVDGHTTAPSLLRSGEGDQEELYPAIIPQNLSKRLTEFAAEVNRCTPKVLVPLDTMPLMFPKRGHPGGYWVDAWSDPYRILLFLDAANIQETVLAHELAHVWIDLVRGIEDYRVLKDKSNSARYAHVQFIQSFVLDIPVNRVLEEKGFDVEILERDSGMALLNLAAATSRGYVPPTKREAAFLGSFLASSMLAAEEQKTGIMRYQDCLLELSIRLPDVYALAERLATAIADNPPVTKLNVRSAVDAALKASFEFCHEELNVETELLEVGPEIAWDEDKHPEWLREQSLAAKCEVGIAMARLGADSMAIPELSYGLNGNVRVRFERDDGGFTEYVELKHIRTIPGVLHPQLRRVIEEIARNKSRMEEQARQSNREPCGPQHRAVGNPFPPFPGGPRSYSNGLAQWITQVRLEEYLAGEPPYAYANNSPVTYTDASGLQPGLPSPPAGPVGCTPQWNHFVFDFCNACARGFFPGFCQTQCSTYANAYFNACGKLQSPYPPGFPKPIFPPQHPDCPWRPERGPLGPPSQIVPVPPAPNPPKKDPIVNPVTGLINCREMYDDCMKTSGVLHKSWCVIAYMLCTAMELRGGAL